MAYLIKSGDTLSQIAAANKTDIATLQKLNPQITNPNLIYAGQSLNLPTAPVAPIAPTPTPRVNAYGVIENYNLGAPVAPTITPISPVIPAPTTTNVPPPEPPQPQALGITDAYYRSALQNLTDTTAALNAARDKQLADTQAQREVTQKQLDELRTLQQKGVIQQGTVVQKEKQKKLDLLSEEKTRFDTNYNIVQGLAGQLNTLLTEGQDLIKQQKAQTGLSSIMTPRINQTISDVVAQAGVIQASISAYNGQMNQVQSQLTAATNVVTSAYSDELDYYKTLYNFYESKSADTNQKLITLTKDEKSYIDNKISTLENAVKTAQTNADYIQKLMTSPESALFMAQADVTLNDPPQVVNRKIATQTQINNVEKAKNTYTKQGYTFVPFPQAGQDLMTISVGGQSLSFKKPSPIPTVAKPLTLWEISEFTKRYGWTPPYGFTEPQLTQFVQDNPTASPAELERGAKEAFARLQGGEPAQAETETETFTTDRLTKEGVQERIIKAKQLSYTNDEIKTAIKAAYTTDELFKIAKDAGYAKWYTGKDADVERMLNALLAE